LERNGTNEEKIVASFPARLVFAGTSHKEKKNMKGAGNPDGCSRSGKEREVKDLTEGRGQSRCRCRSKRKITNERKTERKGWGG